MRQSEVIALASALILGVGALGFGRYVASSVESAVAVRVSEKLASSGFEGVDVVADGLVIGLSGRVGSRSDHEAILAAIGDVEGVGGVVDNLVVVAPLVDLRPATLQVQKDLEALTLTGEAPNAEARDLLAARASVANGGANFLNLMKAQERRAPDAWLTAAEAAIDAVSALKVGRASVERGVVRIEGAAPNAERKKEIAEELRARLRDGFTLRMDITAPPPLLSPYVFAARKTVAGMTIQDCAAPDAAQRSTILGALRAQGEDALASNPDICIIANGAPNDRWTAAVARAIAAIAPLAEAEIRIEDDRVELVGFTDKGADIAAARARAVRDWPAAYTANADIREILPVVRPYTFSAVKRPGEVRLGGYAPSRERAEAWAARLDAVNELQLARGAPDNWSEAVNVVIDALAEQKVGAATISGARFTLAAPGDASERRRLRERLIGLLPEGFSLEVVETKTPRFLLEEGEAAADAVATKIDDGAYSFLAKRADHEGLELGGVVGDETSRSVVQAYARAKLGGDVLEATLALGQETPPPGWQRALFAGLEALGALPDGELIAEPGAVYLRGTAPDAAAAREALAALDAKTPAEYAKFSRIRVAEFGPALRRQPTGAALTPEECVGALNATAEKNPILFEIGSATIDAGSARTVDALAALMNRCAEATIEIGGHTDSQGSDEVNMTLSKQRAVAVRLALISRDVAPDRLSAEGFGETQPVADNDTKEGRARNRRIAFKLTTAAARE